MIHFDQMAFREKVFLAVGAAFLLFVLVVFGIYQPYINALTRADKTIASKQAQVEQLKEMLTEYQTLQGKMRQAEAKLARSARTSVLTLLEGLVARIGSRENINYIRPQPSQVQGEFRLETLDVKLERFSLEQVIRLLWELDRAEALIRVDTLHLKQRYDNSSQLDVTLSVSALRKN